MADQNDEMTGDERRRLLELLASSEDGCTGALLAAHGFTLSIIADVVKPGFAEAKTERIFAGGDAVEVTRVRITYAGRRALAEPQR